MRQNVTVALLSVIATLLAVLVFSSPRSVSGQNATGNATVGNEVAVATGPIMGGGGAALYLYEVSKKRLAVYFLGANGLEVRAVRDISYDLEAPDFKEQAGKVTTVKQMRAAVKKLEESK
jgi:hypothetical protein